MLYPRRSFLKSAAAVGLGFGGLRLLFSANLTSSVYAQQATGSGVGFGPLIPDPSGMMSMPEGFSYQVLSQVGDTMDDGLRVPAGHDGMAAFTGPRNSTILVRNHELGSDPSSGPFGDTNNLFEKVDRQRVYDTGGGNPAVGGTTTVVFDHNTRKVRSHFLSLVGTRRNCAGGRTPWNTWISCEETVTRAGEEGCMQDHGYNFEVPVTSTPSLANPVPLRQMGRFVHEAVAVDPRTGIVYQTEDRGDSLIYRYIPKRASDLSGGGQLQCLAVIDAPSLDTRNWEQTRVTMGERLPVHWVDVSDIADPDSGNDTLRLDGFERGGARFARGEGMYYGNDTIYFVCTSGGSIQKGQVWAYRPSPDEGHSTEMDRPGSLELFIEPNDANLVENADNVAIAPWGDLILCEDGPGDQYLVGVTPAGELYKLAHNQVSNSVFAGATFSSDGRTLFVNIQGDGLTLAIEGPWPS